MIEFTGAPLLITVIVDTMPPLAHACIDSNLSFVRINPYCLDCTAFSLVN